MCPTTPKELRDMLDEVQDLIAAPNRTAARFYPLPVRFNGEAVPQEPFLKNAIRTERWRGVTIGVMKGHLHSGVQNVNFHGVTFHAEIASLAGCGGNDDPRYVAIDVDTCAEIKMVLPARKEVIASTFLKELKEEAECALYRAVQGGASHTLGYGNWLRAKELGIELPEANPELIAFTPRNADDNGFLDKDIGCSAGEGILVLNTQLEPPLEQCLARAFNRTEGGPCLVRARSNYAGYSWYDALPKIETIEWWARGAGIASPLGDVDSNLPEERPQEIYALLGIATPSAETTLQRMDTDLWLPEESYELSDVIPVVTESSTIHPHDLADTLVESYFCYCYDADAESYHTQRRWAEEEAERIAFTLLVSASAAAKLALRNELNRTIRWHLPKDRRTVIVHEGGRFTIFQLPHSVAFRLRSWLKRAKKIASTVIATIPRTRS